MLIELSEAAAKGWQLIRSVVTLTLFFCSPSLSEGGDEIRQVAAADFTPTEELWNKGGVVGTLLVSFCTVLDCRSIRA
jgi:hypothetical protein